MNAQLSLSVVEIIVLMLGAITLGITIHFFISSRRSLNETMLDFQSGKSKNELTEWKLRYFNDMEVRDKELTELKKKLEEAEENVNIYSIEAEEVRALYKKAKAEAEENRRSTISTEDTQAYVDQLRLAQQSLLEHNRRITDLLDQVDLVKENEIKRQELVHVNDELVRQMKKMKEQLVSTEEALQLAKQKQQIGGEVASMIDNAYSEFNLLQGKIQKLETQVHSSRKINLEYEDLKVEHQKVVSDLTQLRSKNENLSLDNSEMEELLQETERKLAESNLQRQQLQRKVAYLEELNNDMQIITETNKKLEGQMKRIGELESMLNVVSEERDELAKRHTNS